MKRLGLLVMPVLVIPFLVNCNHNTYHFKFIGNHCTIDGKTNFDANVTKNKSNVQYTITPDDGYQLDYLDNEYQEDFTLESNVLTILEMKQDYTITVNAIDENIVVTLDVDINSDYSGMWFTCKEEDEITEVDWGDGTKDTKNKHSYNEEGSYSIVIRGDIISFGASREEKYNNIVRANIYSKNITSIAFANCVNLVSVNLPNEMATLGYDGGTFSNCTSLKSIKLPKNLTYMSGVDFKGCSSLTSIVIPEGVLAIGNSSFDGCTNLASIVLPSKLVYIGGKCFRNCVSLTSIVIPDNVASIEYNTFYNCTNLASINIPTNSMFHLVPDDFCNGTAVTSIKIPNNVTEILAGAFARCSNLVLADLSEVDHVIGGGHAFGNEDHLKLEFKIKV